MQVGVGSSSTTSTSSSTTAATTVAIAALVSEVADHQADPESTIQYIVGATVDAAHANDGSAVACKESLSTLSCGAGVDHSLHAPGVTQSGVRSVGQRIKEASSLLSGATSHQDSTNGNSATGGNQLSPSSLLQQRHCRTTPLHPLSVDGCMAAGVKLGQPQQYNCNHNANFHHSPSSGGKQVDGAAAGLPPPPTLHLNEMQRSTLRIIGQYLRDLGMNDTVDSLVEESGCRIENALSIQLRDHVKRGEWKRALNIVEKLRASITERQYLTVRVLLLEEEFKHLLSQGNFLLALHLLQTDYPREREFRARQEHLAILLMARDGEGGEGNAGGRPASSDFIVDYLERQDKEKNNEEVLKVLHKVLPPSMMLPPARLEELLKQSWQYQAKRCDLHLCPGNDDEMDEQAILKDHHCSVADFPSQCTQILNDHCSEVWCLEFSPCGRYLASGAKSNCVLVWKVDSPQRLSVHRRLKIDHDLTGIASLSWSQDSKYLAICSTEENNTGAFIYHMQKGLFVREYRHFPNDSFSVVCFFKNNSHRLAAGSQKGHFVAYDVRRPDDSPRLIEGFRIRCLYGMKDGKTVLAADTHNRIRQYNFETLSEMNLITENNLIMYFTVDKEERHCLVTTKTEGIHLWCLKTRCLLRSFFGSVHSEFVITSSFGGIHNNFIASGSEDEQVVIWNVKKSQAVRRLTGHTGTVNAVSWNPKHHGMLASGSDDGTIRIWSTRAKLTSQ